MIVGMLILFVIVQVIIGITIFFGISSSVLLFEDKEYGMLFISILCLFGLFVVELFVIDYYFLDNILLNNITAWLSSEV